MSRLVGVDVEVDVAGTVTVVEVDDCAFVVAGGGVSDATTSFSVLSSSTTTTMTGVVSVALLDFPPAKIEQN